jgi:geranylgeranyl pyrophosphate synthase
MERVAGGEDARLLERFHANKGLPPEEVPAMLDLYTRHGILDAAREDARICIDRAERSLDALPATPARDMLCWFARMLMNRSR